MATALAPKRRTSRGRSPAPTDAEITELEQLASSRKPAPGTLESG
jgi:hypothetical protein